jgi:RHS repeat-associated protein
MRSPWSATTQLFWDRNNRLFKYIDAETNTWLTTFTGYDSPLTITDPLIRTGTYIYTPGFLTPGGMIEPNRRQTSYKYDTDMQLTDIFEGLCPTRYDIRFDPCTPLQVRRHYDYTADGQHVTLTSAPGVGNDIPVQATVTQTYDSVQRPVDESVAGTDISVHHGYTDAGRTITTVVTDSSAFASYATMAHHYDSMGRLGFVDLNESSAAIATWTYGTGVGGPLSLTYANGATTAYQYDSRLRQTGMDVTFAGGLGTTPIASLHDVYGRDSSPRMRQRKFGNGPTMTDVYQVDGDGRMLAENLLVPGVNLPSGEVTNSDVATYMQPGKGSNGYGLDKIGNIRNRTSDSSSVDYTNDALSRLTAVGAAAVKIDDRDNLQSATIDTAQFVFDEFSGDITCGAGPGQDLSVTCPAQGTTNTYEYDALDRRMVEHGPGGTEERFVWDGTQLIAHGVPSNLILEIPSNDIDGHVAAVDGLGSAPAPRFYHQGPDQSVIAISDSQGLVEGYSYSAFGEVSMWAASGTRLVQSTVGNRFLYQGQVYDSLTATYSMRARQYQPKWGRFVSPDPLSIAAGPSLYSFTGARPLSRRDPLGLDPNDDNPQVDSPPPVELVGPTYYIDDRTPQTGQDTPQTGQDANPMPQPSMGGALGVGPSGGGPPNLGGTGAPSAAPGPHSLPSSFAPPDNREFCNKSGCHTYDLNGPVFSPEYVTILGVGVVTVVPMMVLAPGARVAVGVTAACNAVGCRCFAAGTQVEMYDGTTKRIEDIQVGDVVLAEDPEIAETLGGYVVTELHRNSTIQFFHIRIGSEVDAEILATSGHLFWTGRGWVKAEDLEATDILTTPDGRTVPISSVAAESRQAPTFNLTVEGTHTYFVVAGLAPVLVHNECEIGTYSELRAAFLNAGMQVHHLIEQRFADIIGQDRWNMASTPLTAMEHQVFTNQWSALIPRMSEDVTPEQVFEAAKTIYANFPEFLKALGL